MTILYTIYCTNSENQKSGYLADDSKISIGEINIAIDDKEDVMIGFFSKQKATELCNKIISTLENLSDDTVVITLSVKPKKFSKKRVKEIMSEPYVI